MNLTDSVVAEIAAERQSHIQGTPSKTYPDFTHVRIQDFGVDWPWEGKNFKPKDRRASLVKAAALLVAEIERLTHKLK